MAGLALQNTEQLYNRLMASPQDVVTNSTRAAAIWRIFRKYPIDPSQLEPLSYRAFLQAALMAAIDGSAAMGWVEQLWSSSVKVDATAQALLKDLAKYALKKYYKRLKGDEPELYHSVVTMINYQCSAYFESMKQGLDI